MHITFIVNLNINNSYHTYRLISKTDHEIHLLEPTKFIIMSGNITLLLQNIYESSIHYKSIPELNVNINYYKTAVLTLWTKT